MTKDLDQAFSLVAGYYVGSVEIILGVYMARKREKGETATLPACAATA